MKRECDLADELGVLGETERQRQVRAEERRRYNLVRIVNKGVAAIDIEGAIRRFGPTSKEVHNLLGSRYEATVDGFVDKATGALVLDLEGNPIKSIGGMLEELINDPLPIASPRK
jgi:hypothetical protein